jgi:hypothetical protein
VHGEKFDCSDYGNERNRKPEKNQHRLGRQRLLAGAIVEFVPAILLALDASLNMIGQIWIVGRAGASAMLYPKDNSATVAAGTRPEMLDELRDVDLDLLQSL